MRHWNRNVYLAGNDLEDWLAGEIKRRWPEADHQFHIRVLASENRRGSPQIEVYIWNDSGLDVSRTVSELPLCGTQKPGVKVSPTVNAVLHTVETAVIEAEGARRSLSS
jgi:hypothetical protein